PDCIGNRSFCKDFFNCLMPSYNINTIIYSINVARSSKHEVIQEIINNGLQTAKNHDIHFERKKFLQLLENLYKVWSEL
ncbi:MAG: glycosyltransferase family 1 protein, partial [Candidatus Woesearchaeota archaeon]